MFKQIFIVISVCYCIGGVYGEEPIIQLPNGQIRGQQVQSIVNENYYYYAYQEIPFAAPSIGNRRFQSPQPVENWEGIKDVLDNQISCYQVDVEEEYQTEDCLYLNVYTPTSPLNNTKLDVLVFIYGGAFIHGHMTYGHKKAGFLMEEDIILVTFNYRVGPFGFLSTGDTVISGNMGLKDQQFALKWVQNNIGLFGGDPQKVTLMGQSAGSASVMYHLMAPGSVGLFRAAIGCSGSVLNEWAYQKNARDTAYGIAIEIDQSFNISSSTKELLKFLQIVSAESIAKTKDKYNLFSPVIEESHDEAIISKNMYETAENGSFHKIPVLMGINSEEGIHIAHDMAGWTNHCKGYDQDPRLLVDDDMYITDQNLKLTVGEQIKAIYTSESLENNLGNCVQYYSDNRFTKAIIKFAELISKHVDLYFYQFSYKGELGKLTSDVEIEGIGSVAHAEDQRYFWSEHDDYSKYPELDVVTVRRYNKLFANFIKQLNPTPVKDELFQNVIWKELTKDQFYYFDINQNLTVQENPRNFSYGKWVDIFEKYVPKPFISY